MKLFYVDESGTGLKNKNIPYFLLAALSIDMLHWHEMDKQISQLKRSIFPYMKPEDFEIKGSDIRQGKEVFKKLKWIDRVGILKNIAEVLNRMPCQVFAVSFNKLAMQNQISSEEEAYRITFSCLLDKMNTFLQECSDQGLLLMDSRSDLHSSVQDRRLIDVYREWIRDHETRFIELPWFGFSNFYSGLQLADVCAYLCHLEKNEGCNKENYELVVPIEHSGQITDIVNILRDKILFIEIP
jgi:hypothetical protein